MGTWPLATLGVVGLCVLAPSARAAGEQEWELGVAMGYASVGADGRRPSGAGVGADVQYGFSDTWAAHLALDSSVHGVDESEGRPAGNIHASSIAAGLTYTLDVLRLVPFLEFGLALVDVRGAVLQRQQALGFMLGLGAEYLVTRHWGVGLVLRYQHFPFPFRNGPTLNLEGTPAVFSAALRLSYLF